MQPVGLRHCDKYNSTNDAPQRSNHETHESRHYKLIEDSVEEGTICDVVAILIFPIIFFWIARFKRTL
jgi:hypothetical protein